MSAMHEEFVRQGNWLFKNRSLLPLIVLIVCYGYYVFNIYVEDPFYQTISNYCPSYKYGCLLTSLVGVAIRVYTIGYAPAGTSGRNTDKQIADELNTTGIYSIIRHPLYFGNYLMSLGIVLLPRSVTLTVIFTLIFWLYYERIMYAEEDFLRHKFGQDFLNWSARVPTFLPRRITGRATLLPFSWKKVLRQEKNGVWALFLIYFFFDITESFINRSFQVDRVLLTCAIVSTLVYIVLKILKKYTNALT